MLDRCILFLLVGSFLLLIDAYPPARDCWDLRQRNIRADGVYTVMSPSGSNVSVRCDMTTDGGGWIVFQKRYNGLINFDQTFDHYKRGFGIPKEGEFWMGNGLIHEFTKDRKQSLRVDICDWSNNTRYANYNFFLVGPETDNYRLSVARYSGDAGDALIEGNGGGSFSNSMEFSTPEADHDISHLNCAASFGSGFWFATCYSANLNGRYIHHGPLHLSGSGIRWRVWIDSYSFKATEMKFRPATVPSTHPVGFSCPTA